MKKKKILKLIKKQDNMNAIVRTIEEMSELTKVLSKYLKRSKKFKMKNLTEELSHVMLMANVTRKMFGIKKSKIMKEKLDTWDKSFLAHISAKDIKKMRD